MDHPIVTVREGRLRGAQETLHDGSTYYSFKGVPYAQPPVGELRFRAPLPREPWTGIYEALKHGPVCPQFDSIDKEILEGDENCLFLNVYTRSLQEDRRTPVMVSIHGGGFLEGSGNSSLYGPDFIIQHDVVLVTINYRLEVFGFLCLDTPQVPGNAGMKDQVAALRWVQNNIAQFGGDPNNVTIFGISAGSASVTHHLFSPMLKGLFHKAIAQSGVCTADWAVGNDARMKAFKVGKALGKDTSDTTELLEFLKTVPSTDLINITSKLFTYDEELTYVPILFPPVIEKSFDNVEPFITEDPVDVLVSGKINKVPLMIGYTSQEGLLFLSDKIKNIDFINKNLEILVPPRIAKRISQIDRKQVGNRIRQFYVGDKCFAEDTITELSHSIGDPVFVYPTHWFTHRYSKYFKHLYMYKFNCDTDLNIYKKNLGFSNVKGACHADDWFYMFLSKYTPESYQEDETMQKLVHRATRMWTDFAKFGNPTPDESFGLKWPSYTTDAKEFLHIDETLSLGRFADRERCHFWDQLHREAGLPSLSGQAQ